MKILITLLRVAPLALAALLQLATSYLSTQQAREVGASQPLAGISGGLYALSGIAAGAAVICYFCGLGSRACFVAALVAGIFAMAGPLIWGCSISEFHLSHHLVRLCVVSVVVGLFCWHVTSYR